MGNTVIDTKKIIATIGLSGNVLSKKDLENDCTFSIKNGFVIGANVVTKRDDSKVKSSGTLNTVKAIVLHRTVGYNISGAIGHSKGTHFYVEGGRVSGKDGEIFQSMSLQKSSNHIFNETARTSHLDIKTNNSIGIEVIGMAYKKVGEKYYTNTSNPKEIDTTKTPITKGYKDKNGNFNYWDKLTDSQIKSTVCLVRLLMDSYSIKPEMILTHEEIQSKTSGEGQAVKDAIFDKLIEK